MWAKGVCGMETSSWRSWDWSKITIVALFVSLGSVEDGCATLDTPNGGCMDDELMCTAHQHNARVVVWSSGVGGCPNSSAANNSCASTHFVRNPTVDFYNGMLTAQIAKKYNPATTDPAAIDGRGARRCGPPATALMVFWPTLRACSYSTHWTISSLPRIRSSWPRSLERSARCATSSLRCFMARS